VMCETVNLKQKLWLGTYKPNVSGQSIICTSVFTVSSLNAEKH